MNPDKIAQLEARIAQLESTLNTFIGATDYKFKRTIKGAPDGLRILSNSTEKLGFYGVTPVAQYSTALNAAAGATYGSNEQNMLNAFRSGLISYGLFHS